jgi:integrase
LNGDNRQPVGLHDLRHSYVALALARHANAKVTAQVYAGITEHGREAAAAKLVDAGFGA